MRPYVDALKKEIEISPPLPLKTIFLGGGTPSLLEPEMIAAIMEAIGKRFVIEKNAEITMEANPATVSLEKLKAIKDAGINRLSIGVQSFNNDSLKCLGRIHTADDALNTISYAKKAGFDNISLDLMFGIPGQAVEGVLDDIDTALKISPRHLSVYQLTLEEGTTLHDLAEKGEISLPDDGTLLEMYKSVIDRLTSTDEWIHYEISNFAKPGMECRHNLSYWQGEDYIGLGSSAHSFIEGRRFYNPRDPREYIAFLQKGISPRKGEESESKVVDYLLMRLRLINKELTFSEINSLLGVDFKRDYSGPMNNLESKNLIEINPEGFRVTEKGLLFLNNVLLEFV